MDDCSKHDNLYWFENNSSGQFKRHFIQKNNPDRLERHKFGDIDRDGYVDVVIVKNLSGSIYWLRNPGKDISKKLPWESHLITKKLPGAYDVDIVDLDGDQDLDVAASSWTLGNRFVILKNELAENKSFNSEWTSKQLGNYYDDTRNIRFGDFDNDGDPDLLGTALVDSKILLFENPGDAFKYNWIIHEIKVPGGPLHGDIKDIDGDGDLDFIMAFRHGERVELFENKLDSSNFPEFKRSKIANVLNPFEVLFGDIDADGDLDIVGTSWLNSLELSYNPLIKLDSVYWLENNNGTWIKHPLKRNWVRANQLVLADLNSDKFLDIIAISERGSNEARIWMNLGKWSNRR